MCWLPQSLARERESRGAAQMGAGPCEDVTEGVDVGGKRIALERERERERDGVCAGSRSLSRASVRVGGRRIACLSLFGKV